MAPELGLAFIDASTGLKSLLFRQGRATHPQLRQSAVVPGRGSGERAFCAEDPSVSDRKRLEPASSAAGLEPRWRGVFRIEPPVSEALPLAARLPPCNPSSRMRPYGAAQRRHDDGADCAHTLPVLPSHTPSGPPALEMVLWRTL